MFMSCFATEGELIMNFPNKETVERVRKQYPQRTRVELVSMNDLYATLKPGDRGTVSHVDDAATVFVNWDNGSTLGAVYGIDEIRLLSKAELVKWQCRQVAKMSRTNMFDSKAAFEIALELGFNELADLIFMNARAYSTLILTGELSDGDLVEWP
jgi:hypothetical protein